MNEAGTSIRAVNLCRRFGGVMAIRDLTFEVGAGEVVGFLGPNGAGKSTTMRILTGLISATSGEAWVQGHSVAREREAIKGLIGYMPENNPLPDDLRVEEYLRFRASLKGLKGRRRRERVDAVLDLCDLRHRASRKLIGNLSKGFRQRVGIADTLLAEPPVVILDEPTIGLDPHQVLAFRRLLQSLRGQMTIIISSHILPEIERICDRSIILNRGQVVASGTPAEMRRVFSPGRTYEMVVTGSLSEVEKRVRQADPTLVLRDSFREPGTERRRITFASPSQTDLGPEIIRGLTGLPGPDLHEFRLRESSLEDVFLAATRRGWTEELDEPGPAAEEEEPEDQPQARQEEEARS